MPYIKVADLNDVKLLYKNLRQEDIDEIKDL